MGIQPHLIQKALQSHIDLLLDSRSSWKAFSCEEERPMMIQRIYYIFEGFQIFLTTFLISIIDVWHKEDDTYSYLSIIIIVPL